MPEQFDDGGQGEFLASQMSGAFSEEAARKLCFEQENQIRVLKQEVEYRKKRDEKLTAVTADLTGKLADAGIEHASREQALREENERLHKNIDINLEQLEAAEARLKRVVEAYNVCDSNRGRFFPRPRCTTVAARRVARGERGGTMSQWIDDPHAGGPTIAALFKEAIRALERLNDVSIPSRDPSPEDCESDVCRRCGEWFNDRGGDGPYTACDPCAQELLSLFVERCQEARAVLAKAKKLLNRPLNSKEAKWLRTDALAAAQSSEEGK